MLDVQIFHRAQILNNFAHFSIDPSKTGFYNTHYSRYRIFFRVKFY